MLHDNLIFLFFGKILLQYIYFGVPGPGGFLMAKYVLNDDVRCTMS